MLTIRQLTEDHKTWLPKPHPWRPVINPRVGQINGLPKFRGLAVATNGIHLALETSAGEILIGHFDWFVLDNPDHSTSFSKEILSVPANKPPIKLTELEELFV